MERKIVVKQDVLDALVALGLKSGQTIKLSHILYCKWEDADRNEIFLKAIEPKTENDYVRMFSLVCGNQESDAVNWPFVCREELREYLCQFVNKDDAYRLSESVRKGKFYGFQT